MRSLILAVLFAAFPVLAQDLGGMPALGGGPASEIHLGRGTLAAPSFTFGTDTQGAWSEGARVFNWDSVFTADGSTGRVTVTSADGAGDTALLVTSDDTNTIGVVLREVNLRSGGLYLSSAADSVVTGTARGDLTMMSNDASSHVRIAPGAGASVLDVSPSSGVTFKGMAPDITTSGSEDLTLAAGGKIVATGQSGIAISDTSDFNYANSGVGLTCGAGHRCLTVKGAGSRAASMLIASQAAAVGAVLAFDWDQATDDREVWRLEQTTTAMTLTNLDEDNNAVNLTAARWWDTGGFQVYNIKNTAPTEPVACSATTTGTVAYVDDTNDGARARICLCISTDDTAHDWVLASDEATACPFF